MQQGTYGAVAAFRDETGQEHPWMSQWWMGFAASRKCSYKEIPYWDAARGSLFRVVAHIEFTTWQLLRAFFCSFSGISRGISAGFISLIPIIQKACCTALWHTHTHTPNPTKGGCHQKDPQLLAEHHGGWQSLQWVAMVPKLGASEPPVPKRSRDRRKAKVVILQDIATSVVFFWSRIWLESWSFAYCDEWNMSNWMNWSFFFRFPSCTLSCFFSRAILRG